ncbi:MAG: nucleotidyl transferase AbiEii/AbiGii toxin family protein [Chlamydiae bacterium]|nr:nucleotidyl transferase AbiEii/AbiGii toxin family protein [Chlamydiota bacterium]MBI3276195.1 nucleotidyl transferase AbiEii/AbiGii toxin family protein [Chlamydiota bacterium]
MISRNIANLYARDNKVALDIAERDIVLTYALKFLEEKKWFDRIIFKGGTCLRKFYIGKIMRFSLDLDFTCIGKDNLDDLILEMADLFSCEYRGIRFSVGHKDFYVRDNGLSCGAMIRYSHSFHQSVFDIDLSLREPMLLSPVSRALVKVGYSRYLEFSAPTVPCLDLLELQAEKVRASYQRLRSRDIYDLAFLVEQPFDKELLRKLVVLKFWHVRGEFNPETYLVRLESGAYDWDDLRRLLRKDQKFDAKKILRKCTQGYRFLADLTSEEKKVLLDTKKHHESSLVKKLQARAG